MLNTLPQGAGQRHSVGLRFAHWVVAVLVLATWPLGLMIGFVKDDVKLDFYLVHESLGFLVLWLMLVRLGIRLTGGAVRLEAPRHEKIAAESVHGLLYLFLILMPVSGFLATNAHGFPLKWFGLFEVWSPIGKTPDIAFTLSAIHEWSAWILLGLFALHLAAALFHHVVRRDATLYRIL
ncbi:cytochrome b [Rhizobium sp. G187]|uniref:cytochrome b n=1 Tax=unclassified Rhizobium TaxID=2613769 RepID=UPI0006B91755|nr:cytochrome b/b6 domain-containing protein [Rhizobium sp. AAP43]KPF42185.1 cytochrome B [Rhizobium sp. AAP43]